MPKKVEVFRLHTSGLLRHGDVFHTIETLKTGGLCVVPSDTSYALAGAPMVRGVCRDVNLILSKGDQKIPLAFGTQVMAERYVSFNRRALHLIDQETPGPITIVAPMSTRLSVERRQALSRALNTNNEIGVRFSESIIESRLSSEIDMPLTTSAILYSNGTAVKNFDDAVEIVQEGMDNREIHRELVAIRRGSLIRAGELSTVVEPRPMLRTGDGPSLVIHREGSISEQKLLRSVRALERYSLRDVSEWT
ncbi:L-threonylcarbamoyladenylate synthase [Kribbella sp. NPDC058693]|uniref:L-threonylcarbamoyladenylate synthase n=1 Tax=Kribbella sp. NPDC058693 TaxID=3346602 RepID=UPI003657D28A